jgi:hypothetical protein
MLLKNLPSHQLFPIIFIRLVLDGLAGIQFIFKGKFAHCFAILKAHFYFYHLINYNLKKRGTIQKSDYYQSKSIVFSYFLNQKKQF